MGRAVWVAAVSLILILGISFFCDGVSHQASHQLLQHAAQIRTLAQNGEKEKALAYMERLQTEWEDRAAFLSHVAHHERMDRITQALLQVEAALETGESYALALGLSGLEGAARALHEQEAFMLKNLW